MSNDLKIIGELEKMMDIEIPLKKGNLHSSTIGFRMKGDIAVVGLSLPKLELVDISLIENLNNLSELYLSHNSIVEIDALERLRMLRVLWLNNNQIIDLSPIQGLVNIQELWINDNLIKSIAAVRKMRSLGTLILNNNHISDISPLKDLLQLEVADLRDNPIEELPSWILDQRNMEINWYPNKIFPDGLTFFNNPLVNPPIEIVQLGKSAVRAWFNMNIATPINEAKILFVGNGGVGKTTIIKCLTSRDPDPNEEVTHKIQITTDRFYIDETEILLNYWDFGGQEVMHSTHQFFFSRRCVYVLVIDARIDESPENWLRLIESLGGDSSTLVVLNKIDANPYYELDKERLKEKYPFILGFYSTSCRPSGITGITDLFTGIENSLRKATFSKRKWPANWIAVKRALSGMEENFISQFRYGELCNNNNIRDPKIQIILAEYLHDLGVIVYAKGIKPTNMHILQPQWAATAAYKIITSNELSKKRGIFQKDDLLAIMRKNNSQDYEYPLHTFGFILELMEKFELCYSLPDGRHYLVPDLLSIQRPQLPDHYGEVIRFVFEYEKILPQSIITRFMVRMHNDIVDNLHWRTGVVIRFDVLDGMAIIMADIGERRIYITVSGEDRREYLSIIRKNFEEIHKTFQKLVVTEKIDLSESGAAFVDYNELQGISTMKEKSYISGQLRKKFDLEEIFEKVEPASKRTSNRVWDVFIIHSSIDKPLIKNILCDLNARNIKYWIDDEQIDPGSQTLIKIMDGLGKSNIVIPCISKNQLRSGWCQKEYTSVLNRIIGGMSDQIVAPLILDDTNDEMIPTFLSDLRYERYLDASRYKRFLDFLERKRTSE